MYSIAKVKNHPIHPMLVGFPITFYILTLVAFVTYQAGANDIFWYKLGVFSNYAAIACAVVTAVPGFIDWAFGVPNYSSAKARGLIHMGLNLTILALYIGNAFYLYGSWENPVASLTIPIGLCSIGVVCLLGAAYYGWEMISLNKLGVEMTPEQERLQKDLERKEPPLFH
jgi:uncharacterized membrane protein